MEGNAKRVLQHHLHDHALLRVTKAGSFSCELCWQQGTGPRYGCDFCLFYLHTTCADFPPTVLSPLHPGHEISFSPGYRCHLCHCNLADKSLAYACDPCNFYVHPNCLRLTFLRATPHDYPEQIRHPACDKMFYQKHSEEVFVCGGCKTTEWVKCRVYAHLESQSCKCGTILHRFCATRRKTLNSPIHIEHDLILGSWQVDRRCGSCHEVVEKGLYECKDCNFVLHASCAFKSMRTGNTKSLAEDPLYFFMHPTHDLTLVHQKDPPPCQVCGKPSEGDCYACAACDFHIHKACSSIKPTVVDKAHPHHILHFQQQKRSPCVVCSEDCLQWRYCCNSCNVSVHKGCLQGPVDQ